MEESSRVQASHLALARYLEENPAAQSYDRSYPGVVSAEKAPGSSEQEEWIVQAATFRTSYAGNLPEDDLLFPGTEVTYRVNLQTGKVVREG